MLTAEVAAATAQQSLRGYVTHLVGQPWTPPYQFCYHHEADSHSERPQVITVEPFGPAHARIVWGSVDAREPLATEDLPEICARCRRVLAPTDTCEHS